MFSIYFSAFNLIKNKFPYEENLKKALKFADEVVVAVNKSEDATISIIESYVVDYPNLKVIETSFSYDDIKFDGAIKNAALQATTQPIKIQMDLDEYIPLSQKTRWESYAKKLLNMSDIGCFLIPSIDLYGSRDKIRAHTDIGVKFRMHKSGYYRGIQKDAWVSNTRIRTDLSDTTELIDSNGNVVSAIRIAPKESHIPFLASSLQDYLYTIHEGYLSFEHRVNINKEVWAKAWKDRSGRDENTPTNIRELEGAETTFHNLKLE